MEKPLSLFELLKKSASNVAKGDPAAARDVLKESFSGAMQAEPSKGMKELGDNFYTNIWTATDDNVYSRLDRKAFDVNIMKALDAPAGAKVSAKIDYLKQATASLHSAIDKISEKRLKESDLFTKHEQELFEEDGMIGYAKGLIERRWGNLDQVSEGYSLTIQKEAIPDAPQEPPSLLSGSGTFFIGGGRLDASLNHPPKSTVEEITLDGKALEEYGKVAQLDTAWKRLCATGISSVGLGLMVHGGHNVYRAFNPDEEERLEVSEIGHVKPDGTNWTRLAVGVTEAAAGAVVLHRGLTGHWNPLNAVEGQAEPLFNCEHVPAGAARG